MNKNVFGRKFGRDIHERKALFRSLASSLVMHERITTTEQKAKAIKGHVEKLVTRARQNDIQALRHVKPYLNSSAAVKMMTDIAPRFTKRPGGYTRIIKIKDRFSDNASMVILEWVEKPQIKAATADLKEKKSKKQTALKPAKSIKKPTKKTKEKNNE